MAKEGHQTAEEKGGSGNGCPVEMRFGQRCGRPIHPAPEHDKTAVCLMHSRDPGKDDAEFQREFEAILEAAGDGVADLKGFVFPTANYGERKFLAACVFSGAMFTKDGVFSGATFTEGADFSGATFTKNAVFSRARFTEDADFSGATFMQKLSSSRATFAKNADFSGSRFTEDAVFSHARFTEDAVFGGATFTKNTHFRDAKFAQNADFSGATFTEDAVFSGATLMKGGVFRGATFTKNADFNGVTFTKNANFRGAKFMQGADFSGVTFTEDAAFYDAKFMQNADFSGARFTEDAVFGGAMFTQKPSFSRATFAKDAVFSDARFTQKADFSSARFTQKADFSDATFTQKADFRDATFTQGANFGSATFAEGADFVGGMFTQDAIFSGAKFKQAALFRRATFAQDAHFGFATFTQEADFSGARFTQEADFGEVTFQQEVLFNRSQDPGKFEQRVSFQGAKFWGRVEFRETEFRGHNKSREERAREFLPGPTFSLAEFGQPEKVIFYKTYLGQALFHNCDISRVTFSSVVWRERKGSGMNVLFEEEVKLKAAPDMKPAEGSRDERNYGLIAELYQQLKKNYDERKDYWTAGDFHFGELEMKRLSTSGRVLGERHMGPVRGWCHRWFSLVAWYKYASLYGESYARPLLCLALVLLLFTFLFPIVGLDWNDTKSPPGGTSATEQSLSQTANNELSYGHFSDFVRAYSGRKWLARLAFFGNSLMTALSVAGFQKELKYEPSYPWGRALALLELLLTSTLAALFLLAVRRQFRR